MSLSKVSGIQHLVNWAGHFFIIQVYHQPQAVVSLGSKKMHMVSRITQMGVNLWHKSQWKCFKNIPCSTSTPLAAKGCWHKTDWVGELMLLMQSSDPAYPASEKKKKRRFIRNGCIFFSVLSCPVLWTFPHCGLKCFILGRMSGVEMYSRAASWKSI